MDAPHSKRHTLAAALFWIFVAAYVFLLVWHPQFGMIDDSRLLDTILAGKRLPWFIEPLNGRYAPLQGQEYNLVRIFATTAFAFFLVNAAELILAAWLLLRLGRVLNKTGIAPYIVAACVMLQPGFTESWFRLFVPERTEFLCIAGLFLAYLRLRETGKPRYLLAGLACGAVALFCKETAFVLVGGLGFFDLVFDRRSRARILGALLLLLSAIWLALYYFESYRFRGKYLYGAHAGGFVSTLAHALAATLLHDPLLLVVLLAAAFLLMRRRTPHPAVAPSFKVALCTAAALVAAYLVLGMSNNYYLLPAYVFAAFLAVGLLEVAAWSSFVRNPVFAGVVVLLLLNQTIVGLQQYTLWRTDPQQFQKMVPVLAADVRSSSEPRQNIFLPGVDRGESMEAYYAVSLYLEAQGISPRQFDLRSSESIADPVAWLRLVPQMPSRDFSYDQTTQTQAVQPGDLLIVLAGTPADVRRRLQDSAQYKLVYRTDALAYPNLSLKRIARSIVTRGRPGLDDRLDPNYLIYEKVG